MNKKYLLGLLLFALLGTQPSSAQGFFKKLTKAIGSAVETVNKVTGNSTSSKSSTTTESSTTTSQSSKNTSHERFKDFFDSNIENVYQYKDEVTVEIALTNKKDYPIADVNSKMIFIPGQPQKYVVTINNPDNKTKVQGKLDVLLYRQDLPGDVNFTVTDPSDYYNRKDKYSPLYENSQGVTFEVDVEQKPDVENLVWCNRKDIAVSDCYVHAIKNQPYFHCKIKNMRSTPIEFNRCSVDGATAYDEDGTNYSIGGFGYSHTYINRCDAFPDISTTGYFQKVFLEPNSTMDYDVCISSTTNFSKGEYTYLRLYLLGDYVIYCTNLKFK